MAEIVHKPAEELRAEIAEILREHPSLDGLDPSEACCSGCFTHEVAGAFGWDAADAWERLQSLYFLLGGTE
jgi:hypothetical protein